MSVARLDREGSDGPVERGTFVSDDFEPGALLEALDAWQGYAFVALDRTGRTALYDRNMQILLGFPSCAVARDGLLVLAVPAPERRLAILERLRGFLDSAGDNEVFHWTLQRHDGLPVTVAANCVALSGKGGPRQFVFLSCCEIDAPPGAFASDGAAQRGFRELVENSPALIVRFRPGDRHCLYVNRAVKALGGQAPEAFYADPSLWERLIVPDDRAAFTRALVQAGQGSEAEVEYRWLVGRRIVHLSQKLYPIRDDTGTVFALEGVAHDQSDRRSIERCLNQLLDEKDGTHRALQARMHELEEANQRLRGVDRLKSEILANVSHELRTPLVTICGYAELLASSGLGPLCDKQRQALEVVKRSGRRLSALIENMLESARLDDGRVVLRRESVDLCDVVREIAEELEPRLPARRLRLALQLERRPVRVHGDRVRLMLLVRNLAGNAEKFTEGGGAIRLTVRQRGRRAELVVADDGVGIPHEHQERIFDRFYQVDGSAARRHGGAGLGLAIVREVVALHGGTIALDSAPGNGARFVISLPLAAGGKARPRRRARADPPARPRAFVGGGPAGRRAAGEARRPRARR